MKVASDVRRANYLYELCRKLFVTHPLAADAGEGETIRSMVLVLRDPGHADYYVLSQERGEGECAYSIQPWPTGPRAHIEPNSEIRVPNVFASAIMSGVPVPRDGSLLGWKRTDAVTALIAVYTEYELNSSEPYWSVMPRVGTSGSDWPPFTGEPLIGSAFWELHQAGNIVSVEKLIAGTRDTVFWVDTAATIGSGCCAVVRDMRSPEGYTLPSGIYVYYKALREGTPMPSLRVLLADTARTDLASRF